jgi:hypothetical protein
MMRTWKSQFRTARAAIEYGEAENENGYPVETVTARCLESGREGEETFGDSPASIRRALLTLTRVCSCGASFHSEAR